MGQEAASLSVTNDAQFGALRVLKPYTGFEAQYQGLRAVTEVGFPARPVIFTPVGEPPTDPAAGKEGFDPNLLNFMPVTEGARLKIWVPAVHLTEPDFIVPYRYQLHWRQSDMNVYLSRLDGQYHIPNETPGAADTTAPIGQQTRFIIPSANSGIFVDRALVADPLPQASDLKRDVFVMRSDVPMGFPILPNGNAGVYQQGIADPAVDPNFAALSAFVAWETIARGDRLLITAEREPIPEAPVNWNFDPSGGLDFGFSNLYGTAALGTPHASFPFVGIYVLLGAGG